MEGGHYWAEHLSSADTERGQIPVAREIRSGSTQVCHDVSIDPPFNPWREAIQARGYHAKIALPLRDDGKTFGDLSIYSLEGFRRREIHVQQLIIAILQLSNECRTGKLRLVTGNLPTKRTSPGREATRAETNMQREILHGVVKQGG